MNKKILVVDDNDVILKTISLRLQGAGYDVITARDGAEAVRLGERACKITQFKEPVMVGTLAVAYAEAGRFDEAVATARKARELALAAGQQGLADENQKLIQFFSARQPYRDPTQP